MLRKACMNDVAAIQKLVNNYADEDLMLPLVRANLYDHLRDFTVFAENNNLVGVVALHFSWEGLAEIRSLAVQKDSQKQGIGRKLLKQVLAEAREYKCERVFTLTYIPAFFAKMGFKEISKDQLPHKIWSDCLNCHHFPDCNELAMIYDFA